MWNSYRCFALGNFLCSSRNVGTSESRWHEFQVAGLEGGEADLKFEGLQQHWVLIVGETTPERIKRGTLGRAHKAVHFYRQRFRCPRREQQRDKILQAGEVTLLDVDSSFLA